MKLKWQGKIQGKFLTKGQIFKILNENYGKRFVSYPDFWSKEDCVVIIVWTYT